MKTKISLLLMLFVSICAMAQQIEINGVVTSKNDAMPLPGVSIIIKGTSTGTTSDFEGAYSLLVNRGDQVEYSYIGFETVIITIEDETNIDVALVDDVESLSEVVVIGYGTQKRKEVTGAIASVSGAEITKQPAVNALQSIQGKMTGVNIVNTNAPGSEPNIIIRGIGTASSGSDILYIVDGVQVNSITNINPDDIETFDVLKDAASASIYGMNAANGVVIVTTKSGKKGKMKIELSSYYGAKSMLNAVEMANSSQYVRYFNENQMMSGETTFLSPDQPYDTDWYEELTDIGFSNSNNVAISGASDDIKYFFSFNNYTEDGVLDDHDYNRNTIRANNSVDLFEDRLTLSTNLSASFIKSLPKPFSAFNSAYRQAPVIPVYYESGQYGQSYWNQTTGIATYLGASTDVIGSLNSVGNPVAAVEYTNQENNTTDLQGSFQADFNITDDLKVSGRYTGTKSYSKSRSFNDTRALWLISDPTRTDEEFQINQDNNPEVTTYADNSLSYTSSESYRYNLEGFLTYDKTFNSVHNLNAVAGLSRGQRNDVFTMYALGYGVPSQENYWSINFADDGYEKVVSQYYSTPTREQSYFGRVMYNYDGKYFLQANIRRDGTSNFKNDTNEDYFDNFPAVSAGWSISNEDFFNVSFIDFLKLKAGWGQVGNSRVPFNQSTITTSTGSSSVNYVFGANQDLVFGAAYGAEILPISWEITEELNAGFNLSAFDSRLNAEFNYYNRNTKNAILLVTPIYTTEGSGSFYDHGAEVTNKGIEIDLKWRDNITDDLSYNIGAIFSTNKNNVENVKSAYDGQVGGSLGNGQITKRLEEGQPLYSWWMYDVEGVWQNQEEIDNGASISGALPGHLKYSDLNDDGIIDDKDKKFFGSYLPTYSYGLSLGLNYKNVDLIIEGYGAGGNKIYNGLKGTRINGGENIAEDVFNYRWTGEGSTNSDPGANRDSYASSYYLEDGDYFRINNITLGYTLKDVIKGVSSVRLYATAQNPFMFTKYSGFTPEIIGSSAGTGGIELSAYPTLKTFLFGVNIEL
ncbi:SusC/RagA family TonB-linked outer membrane protein [Winogradskyella psychrotolerans]|uniref:SusC/RagA family TonB-linked outer membrane protein n=1 Tax=Winogradskyella psychrotolerans TaxID=1344585 RepID=UPI001C07A363|nr:SusC/RagA family TonB-linked outer membrane protein [Winogradskyella psychrotolerans]MBU2927667.1 SusC/RagA family TonB-linked outer membrane protein [Winogradskyella psychrotolerans]